MLSELELEKRLFKDFLEVLKNIPGFHIADIKHGITNSFGDRADAVVEINTPSDRWIMPIELKSQAYPRDVREAVWTLEGFRYENQGKAEVVPMLLAERISEGAKKELKSRHIGFYDSSGSFYLQHLSWFIDIQRPLPKARKSVGIDLFTGSREMVVHALLQTKGEWFSGEELSISSETSAFTVSGVLRELELREWVVKSKEGGRLQRRKLVNPTALLDAWVEGRQKNKPSQEFGYIFSSDTSNLIMKIMNKMDTSIVAGGWALTGAAAANLTSPLLTGVEVVDIIILPKFSDYFRNSIGMKPAEKGYNVILTKCSEASLLYTREREGVRLASDFIQYLDLLDGRGRNAELAVQFRRDILGI
ncbi:hypothetical protein [Edaphovirga cremea]|uniref:hypothetical protein n=1 Tax=Edaphovirga cremea TaxID=2267246 RepID=UPI003988B988